MEEKQKYQRPQSLIICFNPECNKEILKDKSEIRRNAKIGRANYCSRKCNGAINSKHLLENDNTHNLDGYANNRRDKYTVIREHLNRVKNRGKDYDITLDDLLEQWNKQNGTCVYTGIELVPPRKCKDKPMMYKASLDRIDSKVGYIKGNIQFISASANYAKASMTHEEMIEFCEIIANNVVVSS